MCTAMLLATACSGTAPSTVVDEVEAVAATPVPQPTASPTSPPEPTASPTSPPEPTASPTSPPEPTAEPALTLLDQEFVSATAARVEPDITDGIFLFAAIDSEGNAVAGSAGTDAAGNAPTAMDPFRVGSLTKTFTSVAVLTLVEDGLVDLDASAVDYVSRVDVAQDVTVRDLLRHTSGIFNYTDDPKFFDVTFESSDRVWTPEELMEQFGDQPRVVEPGTALRYSNTNYLILGVLIEEVTGQPYHQVMRERVFEPLALSSATYVDGFEGGPEPFDPYEHEGDANYDYTSVATGAWAAGSIVSSAADVHTFFVGLFSGELVSAELVEQMVASGEDESAYGYGLGLQTDEARFYGIYGHNGGIAGYITMTRHSRDLAATAFLVLTDTQAQPWFAIDDMKKGFEALNASVASSD